MSEVEYLCTMDSDMMPECCAQWRMGGKCANTGGQCKFRKVKKDEAQKENHS